MRTAIRRNSDACEYVKNRIPFKNKTRSLWGVVRDPNSGIYCGWMEYDLAKQLRDDIKSGDVTYVVFSYDTPIGWYHSGTHGKKWTIPDAKYSRTTSRHQASLRYWTNTPYVREVKVKRPKNIHEEQEALV